MELIGKLDWGWPEMGGLCGSPELDIEVGWLLKCGIVSILLTFRSKFGFKTDGPSTNGCSRKAMIHQHLPAAALQAEATRNPHRVRTECIRSARAPIRWTAKKTTRTSIWKAPMTKTSSSTTRSVNIRRHWHSFRTSGGSAVDCSNIQPDSIRATISISRV